MISGFDDIEEDFDKEVKEGTGNQDEMQAKGVLMKEQVADRGDELGEY